MFKKTIIAGFALLIAVFAFQPVNQAEAKVRVQIGIGGYGGYNPYYDGYGNRYRPHYRQRYYGPGYYGDYRPRRYRYVPRYRPRRATRRLNCRQARRVVRSYGYRNIRALDCRGKRYTFNAIKHGRWYQVRLNSRNGRLFGVRRL